MMESTITALLLIFACSKEVGFSLSVDARRANNNMQQNRVPNEIPPLAAPPLRISAFNIQVFGRSKLKNKGVTDIITKILHRYDIILIQEIRDSKETSLDSLLKTLNRIEPDDPFKAEVSERLGRTNSKEQYGFLYRPSRVSVADVYQYDDGKDDGTDAFEREPFAVRFSSPHTGQCTTATTASNNVIKS
ncbi:deoxyribonuclease-1-like [Gigantopelta aegis]|uniref:deoxyribonuclease-1-like n=1 Tax=Gigantopelta aegis TaxID=1735272 RepID=UPI001B887A02|nr:deoxyribonuclease-1-like [Gigantopelta aegis]